jgi:uncharacterized protein
MIKAFGNFSTRFPWLIYLIVAAITGYMVYEIKTNLYVESDLTKFLPKSMPTNKANDYLKKNYNYQDGMLIGIESKTGSVLRPEVLRKIEKIVDALKNLKATKTFDSLLTGKKETLTMSLGLDAEDVMSIATLEDAILDKETGAVITGSVIAKLKKENGIAYTDKTEERFPESDEDLKKIIPALQNHMVSDRSFLGSMISEDLTATTIIAPMQRKWDFKKRYGVEELQIAIDPDQLRERYKGNDPSFPFNVYGKKIGLNTYDDSFITKHSTKVASAVKDLLNYYLADVQDDHPALKELMDKTLTAQVFRDIIKYTESRDFFMNPESYTWETFITSLYDFSLTTIDPLSRENLEFKIYDVFNVLDLNLIYEMTWKIVDQYKNNGVEFHIAGTPVVTAVFGSMIAKDMGVLMPFAIGIIFATLLLSFRSARGVIIPLLTVILSMIWALGIMAITGTPITPLSSMLPVVLLSVGSAYGIHFLNRYFEDIQTSTDRKSVLRTTIEHVGIAILMAGLTTIAGFGSLVSSQLSMIKHFGIFSAVGVGFALLLTLTLSPAIMVYWRLPRKQLKANKTGQEVIRKDNLLVKSLRLLGKGVLDRPKTVVMVFTALIVFSAIVTTQLEFEGSQMASFKEDNVIKISDRFLNKKLTGTGQINLLFNFRDNVLLATPEIKARLQNDVKFLVNVWDEYLIENITENANLISKLVHNFSDLAKQPESSKGALIKELNLLRDILNEEYVIESDSIDNNETEDLSGEIDTDDDLNALDSVDEESDDLGGLGDDLDDLSDENGDEEDSDEVESVLNDLSDEQLAGIENILIRLGQTPDQLSTIGKAIIQIRENKDSEAGIRLVGAFNHLQDIFAVDVKQPYVLERLEQLRSIAKAMKSPTIEIDGKTMLPTGTINSPVDLVRRFYKVFYQNDNPKYDRLPNVETDNIADKTMTNRSVIGVVLNQAQNSSRDMFDGMISPDLKEFQMAVMIRDGSTAFVTQYSDQLKAELVILFPENNPYIESAKLTGYAPTILEVTTIIKESQTESIMWAFGFVFVVTFFIFRSITGGLYSLIPLLFTVLVNFGMMYVIGMQITTGTMMVASIAIGIGVDYTIHFLERFKLQRKNGDTPVEAYYHTLETTGKAVFINALSVSLGFLVLVFSDFTHNISMGLLMAGTMVYSSIGALVLLPAVMFITKPKFFFDKKGN